MGGRVAPPVSRLEVVVENLAGLCLDGEASATVSVPLAVLMLADGFESVALVRFILKHNLVELHLSFEVSELLADAAHCSQQVSVAVFASGTAVSPCVAC